jgi:glutamine amidotransferase
VIALIDYKAGNLTSVKKALGAVGADVFVPRTPKELDAASAIIVPGVGHFGATRTLDGRWVEAIVDGVGEGKPLLGICLGMQWLFESSDEAPDLKGLGLLSGRCYRLGGSPPRKEADTACKVPHVGWNSLTIERAGWIAEGVASGAQVYFTHSYVAPVSADAIAVAEHGEPFAAIVQRGRVAGVQFHPEKSSEVGLRILRNFVELAG